MSVPPFQSQFASISIMSADQRGFFEAWLKAWQHGEPRPVDGQISYLFCHMYCVLRLEPASIIEEMSRLRSAYPNEREPLAFYCQLWSSDAYMILERYRDALTAYPEPEVNGRSATATDCSLSIRLLVGERVRGRDIVTLNGPKTTPWGRERLDGIVAYIDSSVKAYERAFKLNILEEWATSSHKSNYDVFRGSVHNRDLNVPAYSFSRNAMVADFVRNITREAENTLREEEGMPRVGEGWLGETELFYAIKKSLPDHQVIQHARPTWLGRQHLDIFFPTLTVAVEYQGPQHDEPVAYFGGQAGFEECRVRDQRKKQLCEENGVRLIYVRPGYKLDEVVQIILAKP